MRWTLGIGLVACSGGGPATPDCETTTFFADVDGDSWGDGAAPIEACTPPALSATRSGDCDDADPDVSPYAIDDNCDGVDDDCDGVPDQVAVAITVFDDLDGDGIGAGEARAACALQPGTSTHGDDCDDTDPSIHPDALERCDGVDNDCNGLVDDADPGIDPGSQGGWYRDLDGDGFGGDVAGLFCEAPSGWVEQAGDCHDGEAGVFPGAVETCNCLDDDCDGVRDQTCDTSVPCSCAHAAELGVAITGATAIRPDPASPSAVVWCDQDTDGGGWTLVAASYGTPLVDRGVDWYADLAVAVPLGVGPGVWTGLRPLAASLGDVRFTCGTSIPTGTVDLSVYDVAWYGDVTASDLDAQTCFVPGGAGVAWPAPGRTDNLTGAIRPVGDDWNAGLVGEDTCDDSGDFALDFDDGGVGASDEDTDWGQADGASMCGVSGGGPSGAPRDAWSIYVREP